MDLPLKISSDPSIHLHKRIIDALIESIESGRLANQSLMPSSRTLAHSLGISRATVSKAYEELCRRGYLVTHRGGKTRVQSDNSKASTSSYIEVGDREAEAILSDYGLRLAYCVTDRAASANMTELNYGGPPQWSLPTASWKQILSRCCQEFDTATFEHGLHPFGLAQLRSAIVDYLARRKAIVCSKEQVIVFAESQGALSILTRLLINEGDVVAVEELGYAGARNIFRAHGANVVPISLDAEGLVIDDLKKHLHLGLKFVYISPSYHDPTGVCMSLSRRQELLRLAKKHDFLIIEDAWDSDHGYISPLLPSVQGLDLDQNVFFLYSFWKALYPLCLVGCLVVPQRYIKVFEHEKVITSALSPVLEQRTLAEFIESGLLERHLKVVTRRLTRMRQLLIEKLLTLFGRSVTIRKQSAAFWLVVQFDKSAFKGDILTTARAAGLVMLSTDPYYVDKPSPPLEEYIVPFCS